LGFIGSNLIRYLLSNHVDYEVINIDKMGIGSNPHNLKDVEKYGRYRFIKGDISHLETVKEVVKEVNAIVNTAAETHVDRSIANPWPFIQSNIIGTFTLLEAVRRFNDEARLIHVSSDEVYGSAGERPFREGDRLNPSSPYSASKAAADELCTAYHRTYGLNVIITRSTNNFGPYQFPEKLIPKTIIRALMDFPVPVYGTGGNVRDWIYVIDHCRALDLVLRKGERGKIYNISAGNELPNIEVVRRILRLMNKPESLITFVEDRPGHDAKYSLDSSKIRSELSWKPTYTFSEALSETINWYVNNEWWWSPIIDEKILHPTPWRLKW